MNSTSRTNSVYVSRVQPCQPGQDTPGESRFTAATNFMLDTAKNVHDFIFRVIFPIITYILYNATMPYVALFTFIKGLFAIPYLTVLSTTLYLHLLSQFLSSVKEDQVSVRSIANLMYRIEALLKNIYHVLMKNENAPSHPITSNPQPNPQVYDKSTTTTTIKGNTNTALSVATEDSTSFSDLTASDAESGGVNGNGSTANGLPREAEKEKSNVDEEKSKENVGVDEIDKRTSATADTSTVTQYSYTSQQT